MFEALSERLEKTFRDLSGKGRLSEEDVSRGLREVRMALLEADVNYKVVREFINKVQERAIGEEVSRALSPAQMVIKIVNEELVSLLGSPEKLDLSGPHPTVLMLVGLQGCGKTTMAAKLAVFLRKQGHNPLLVAADTYRPAAITQLETLGHQINTPVYAEGTNVSPVTICQNGVKEGRRNAHSIVILDTAGRLQIDEQMMGELVQIRDAVKPQEILLIVDAMTGQEAVSVADEFNKKVPLSGLILTKVDGDARGGAALSVRSVTGVPIKFMGVGEKTSDLEEFYPQRLASRILGMGDMLTLIERAESAFTEDQARKMEEKLRSASFTFEDYLEQIKALKNMGPMSEILAMIPGMQGAVKGLPNNFAEDSMKATEAMISSMTREERHNPKIINASRKRRIAQGSGKSVQEVNQLLRQFAQTQKMMKQMRRGKGRGLASLLG